jgi:AcrR family transcriptional regulator
MEEKTTKKTRKIILLSAAKKILAQKGYHDASIDDIICEADIARGTFYLYFKSKRNIFAEILNLTVEEVDRQIEAIRLGAGEPAPVDQVKSNLRRIFQLLLDDPDLARILFVSALGIDDDALQTLNQFYREIADLIKRALEQGISIGLLAKCNPEIASYSILGSVKEVLLRIILTGQSSPEKIDEVIDEIIRINLYGFYARGMYHI